MRASGVSLSLSLSLSRFLYIYISLARSLARSLAGELLLDRMHLRSAVGSGHYSIVRVMEELLRLGKQMPALLALFEWAALGTSTEMGRRISRCKASRQRILQLNSSSSLGGGGGPDVEKLALIEACATMFDRDGNGEFSREEVVGLWHTLQQRALDPELTSREFYIVLQSDPTNAADRQPGLSTHLDKCVFSVVCLGV